MPILELEEFPVPTPVRCGDRPKVHLTDGGKITLCGQTSELTAVELTLEEIDELPLAQKCLRCASAMNGHARIKRFT